MWRDAAHVASPALAAELRGEPKVAPSSMQPALLGPGGGVGGARPKDRGAAASPTCPRGLRSSHVSALTARGPLTIP